MDTELEQLVDTVWTTSLERMMKKEITPIRPSLGDFIDLYIPQTRALLLMETNPSAIRTVYDSAYSSANRNTFGIMKKLGMPADYFWKFEYWPRDRAYETLRKVITKVFTTMMNRNKEGGLELESVEIEPVRFTIFFKECAECAGVAASKPICYYHAATFAGILASLLNREMDSYETKCNGKGDDSCVFIIGKRDDDEIKQKVTEYLSPIHIETTFDDRLSCSLQGNPIRSVGNMVDIGYYNLMFMSMLLPDADTASKANLEMGTAYGIKLAPVVMRYYADNSIEVIKKYYNQMHHLDVKTIEITGDEVNIVLGECAEAATTFKRKELLNFLSGELQGLVSTITTKQFALKGSTFEDSCLRIKLAPNNQV